MNSRWLRQRYYPVFLEEIYKPLRLSLIFLEKKDLMLHQEGFLPLGSKTNSPQSILYLQAFVPLTSKAIFSHTAHLIEKTSLIFLEMRNLMSYLSPALSLASEIISFQTSHLRTESLLKCNTLFEFRLTSKYNTQILNLLTTNIPPTKGKVFFTDLTQRIFFTDLTRIDKLYFTDINRIKKYSIKLES